MSSTWVLYETCTRVCAYTHIYGVKILATTAEKPSDFRENRQGFRRLNRMVCVCAVSGSAKSFFSDR